MNSTQQTFDKKTTYIRGIDGIRALAVLAVMLFHLDASFLPGGFSGVDIFFVISGYVVSVSLARESTSNFLHFTKKFYARRIIRIFPALITCLVVVAIATTLFVPASWLSSSSNKTGLYAFLGLSNFALIKYNDGYFSPRVEFNSFTHTWSLGVEEQFYVIFPLIFFVWLKYKARKGVLGTFINSLLISILTISLLYSWYATSESPDKAFYLLPSRFWELACGGLLFQFHAKKKWVFSSDIRASLFLLIGMLLIGLGLVISDERSFPLPWALLPVSGTVFLISGLVKKTDRKPIIQRFLESSIFVYVGKTSYSLYLWHWPVYVLLRWTLGLETIFEMGLAISLTFILANISYHCIETPFRKKRFAINRPSWQIISVGISVMILCYTSSAIIFKLQPVLSLSVTKDKKTWYPHEWPEEVSTEKLKIFTGRKLFALGDSHTEAYSTMLQKLSDDYGVEVIKFSTGDCGVATLLSPGISKSEECAKNIEIKLSKIEELALPGDILFLASLRMTRFSDQWETFSEETVIAKRLSERAINERRLSLQETVDLIKRFEKLPMHIVIDAPKPVFKSPPFRCSDWFNISNPVCVAGFTMQRDFLLEHRQAVMNSLNVLASDFPELIIWDPFPILCSTDVCSAFKNNKPLFFDGDHLSAHGNRILYPPFQQLIKKIWLTN